MSMGAFKAATVRLYTSYKFGGLLQIMQLNCVQQASINTRVNSSTFTRGHHVCVSLLLARGDTARLCRAGYRLVFATHF